MNKTSDIFLLEIGTEELPPRGIASLSVRLAEQLTAQLKKENFSYDSVIHFATPRRIAVSIEIKALSTSQCIERRGPSLSLAVNANHQPTPAGLGFARACGVDFSELTREETSEGVWLVYRYEQQGQRFIDRAPTLVQQAISSLPLGKAMRWHNYPFEFLRPVHWVVLMYGSHVIPAELLGVTSGNITFGHRFHHPQAIQLPHAHEYERCLQDGKVIASFAKRRAVILDQMKTITENQPIAVVMNDALLDEVTGLVEWPVAYLARYADDFLSLPKEVLLSAMAQHQKCFAYVSRHTNALESYFLTVANIESTQPEYIVTGNERVMRARLSDAAFFFHTDKKKSLISRLPALKKVTFQAKLGTLYEKALRLSELSGQLANRWELPVDHAKRAGWLAKADLNTDMVHEFPELQGVMGYYYAQHDGENDAVATAILEHYLPKGWGDTLPSTPLGCVLAIADRMDNLVGIFSVGQIPSGDKDPFALKRAALTICRILIENNLPFALDQWIATAIAGYGNLISDATFGAVLHTFMIERLRAWSIEQGIGHDTFSAVIAVERNCPKTIHARIQAVHKFRHLPAAQALTAINKRVSKLLQQAEMELTPHLPLPDPTLFTLDAEKMLYQAISKQPQVDLAWDNYSLCLNELASLKAPLDHFFDEVMVMVDEAVLRNNRLYLLAALRRLFLQVADLCALQS